MTYGPSIPFAINSRYPDPRMEVLDERFLKLRLMSSSVEQIASGLRWAEGPQWFGDGRFLLVSDIPNNRILRWDDASGQVSEFRKPSHNANGLARDMQGRLLTCEHQTRRITRTEYNGSITVLADHFEGKRLNSPNDIICQRNGAIWFTDPPFGISGDWEGDPATSEVVASLYRIAPETGELQQIVPDLQGPNGLAFSPDESVLYVVESRAQPYRKLWAYDVQAQDKGGVKLTNKRLFTEAKDHGAIDGFALDVQGNLWCGWGSDGSFGAAPEKIDGVRVFASDGTAIAHIHLPERCANVCFGGAKNNRLFMAASHSVYALYTNTRGAV